MDSELTLAIHINKVCKVCYMHIRNIYKIRRFLTTNATKALVQATITSRLDYCNSLYHGLPDTLLSKLQRIQNASARLITGSSKYDHITPVLQSLHWLPIKFRIQYKICMIVFKSKHNMTPSYIADIVTPFTPERALRSQDKELMVEPRFKLSTYGYREFSNHAPRLWNSLPLHLRNCTSMDLFRKELKTVLFRKAYEL